MLYVLTFSCFCHIDLFCPDDNKNIFSFCVMCVLSICAMGSGIKMYVLLLFVICVGDWEKQREVAFSLTEKSSIKVKIGS